MDAIFKRISIRRYENRPVEPEKIEQILRAAMAAPSTANQQPWEFYVVTNKHKIYELSNISPYSKCAINASVVIVPCFKTKRLDFPDFALIDLAIATENILLEITSLGLGGVWLAVAPIDDRIEKAAKILEIKSDLKPYALVPLGYPSSEDENRTQQDRFDESRVHYLA